MTYLNYPGNLQFVLAKNKVKRVMWKQARIETKVGRETTKPL